MAGLALAVALKDALADAISVAVVDPVLGRRVSNSRASAVAAGPRRMLESLGCWSGVEDLAQPILSMNISDSRPRDVVRPVFLTFARESEAEPFAHMVFNHHVETALERRARDLGVDLRASRVTGFRCSSGAITIDTPEEAVSAALLVAADGPSSRLRHLARIPTTEWEYPMAGIVATIGHEFDHHGCAREHFLPEGPFAVLPLTGRQSSIVWTTGREEARRLVADPAFFASELERRFDRDLGTIEVLDQPRAWPLIMRIARRFLSDRLALVGDAAHVVHPLAGQGINLGFRDVAVLAEAIVVQARLGLDLGDDAVLDDYERSRRFDAVSSAAAMDGMNRLFASDAAPLRLIRDIGLGLVDRFPAAKRTLIAEASGLLGSTPRLFRGELL